MSISWELLADAAVLPETSEKLSLRLTPQAAQRRLEIICNGSFFSLIVLIVILFSRHEMPVQFCRIKDLAALFAVCDY
jgi:hypothetical protein